MSPTRESILSTISQALDARPIRWASNPGDFDGNTRTLEVFNADPSHQRALLRQLRPHRADLEAAAGGAVVVLFHTIAESERLYADFLRSWSRPMATDAPSIASEVWLADLTRPPRTSEAA